MMVEVAEQSDGADLEHWRWLADVIQRLGKDGMSSEDSTDETYGESITRICRPRIMKWRRQIEDELTIIDNQRHLDSDIYSTNGPRPAQRVRSHRNKESARGAVAGLPRSFYDNDWIRGQNDRYLERYLKVSTEKFLWFKVHAQRKW